MPPASITSPANARVKDLVRLQRQASVRRNAGRFCIESRRDLDRALAAGFDLLELYFCPQRLREPMEALPDADAEHIEVSPAVLDKITYRENPEGFVAVLTDRRTQLADLDVGSAPLIMVAAGLEKPGNIGAIVRSADAAGASALFIDAPNFDLFNPNCIRASTGAVFTLPVVCAPPADLNDWLAAHDILRLAATPEATLTYTMLHLRGPVAWIVGSEADGLSDFWRGAADLAAAIPAAGRTADSLNVSTTAGLLLFETNRQRRG